MCQNNNPNKIDECMKNIIKIIPGTFACCCGHGRYHITIILKNINGEFYEAFSGIIIPRKKRFYIKDADGYFNIPEVEKYWKNRRKNERTRIKKRN